MADLVAEPIADALLTCLCTALYDVHTAESGNRPGSCCLRAGDLIGEDIGYNYDECCSGLAYVNVGEFYPTGSSGAQFPNPETDVAFSGCGPVAWGLSLTMGVMRCAPMGSTSLPPTCDEWTAASRLQLLDAQAMRKALCCLVDSLDPGAVAGGRWVARGTEGGCLGGTMTVQVMVDAMCGC